MSIVRKNEQILHKESPLTTNEYIGNISHCVGLSGFGSKHTNHPKYPDKIRQPYVPVTLKDIRNLVDTPQKVPKNKAQWLIPSTYTGEEARTHKYQEEHGKYTLLWADLDVSPPTVSDLSALITEKLCCNYEIYTSRSATVDKQKSRLIIPIDNVLPGREWLVVQQCLNDWLAANNITPDRITERTAQPCYLPNRGAFYETASQRNSSNFNPLTFFEDDIEKKQLTIVLSKAKLDLRQEQARIKREQRKTTGDMGLIETFNDSYLVEDILLQAGYDQLNNTFRHPKSDSGSYSASVKDGRINSLSNSDPLCTGQGAHDSFSAFAVLFHQGDTTAAIKDAGDNWLKINGESWNAVYQRNYAQNKTMANSSDFDYLGTPNETPKKKAPLNFDSFILTGDSETMKDQMLADTFVLGEIAILGQLTALYAKPNSGKTLLTIHLLIEAIKAGNIKGEDCYYINADDTYRGLVTKLELAERYGFKMIAPGFKSFDTAAFGEYLTGLIEQEEAHGKIIILDTLKKFTDIMDKKLSSKFGRMMREFVSKGGTIIMLAHTNKNRDSNGKVIFSGTSDIVDDVDCAYLLDVSEDKSDITEKTVIFENIKSRGAVAPEAAYKYSAIVSCYDQLLASVSPVDEGQAQIARERIRTDALLSKNGDLIEIIIEIIEAGTLLKTDLINAATEISGQSRAKISSAIKDHTGTNYADGHRWEQYRGTKAAKMFKLLAMPQTITVFDDEF